MWEGGEKEEKKTIQDEAEETRYNSGRRGDKQALYTESDIHFPRGNPYTRLRFAAKRFAVAYPAILDARIIRVHSNYLGAEDNKIYNERYNGEILIVISGLRRRNKFLCGNTRRKYFSKIIS